MGLFRELADRLRAFIYPDRCCFCGKVIEYNTVLCKSCSQSVPIIGEKHCFNCGHEIKDCKCRGHANFYDAVSAPYKYENTVKLGIQLWKFGDAYRSVEFFGKNVADAVKKDFADVKFDYICFVPQTREETNERKYNQSEKLALETGKHLGLPVKPVLKKIVSTKRQHDMPWYMRSGNIFGVFDCVDIDEIKGRSVLLIDDIKTTGGTLNECAKMLKLAEAEKVYCAVIAIA